MLKLGLLYFTTMGSAFAIFIYTNPDGFLEMYRATAPSTAELLGNKNSELLIKLVMKWWAFAIAQLTLAMLLVTFAAPEAFQRLYLRVVGVFASGLSLLLTWNVNLGFSKTVNGDAPVDMNPIYFNLALNLFGVLVAVVCSAESPSSKTKGH